MVGGKKTNSFLFDPKYHAWIPLSPLKRDPYTEESEGKGGKNEFFTLFG